MSDHSRIPPSDLLTIKEVIEQTRLCRASVYKLINAGDLPVLKLCGRTLVRCEDLARLIAASVRGAC